MQTVREIYETCTVQRKHLLGLQCESAKSAVILESEIDNAVTMRAVESLGKQRKGMARALPQVPTRQRQ